MHSTAIREIKQKPRKTSSRSEIFENDKCTTSSPPEG